MPASQAHITAATPMGATIVPGEGVTFRVWAPSALKVSVSGPVDADTGMVVNLKDLDRAIKETLVDHVDHRHLNHDVPFLAGTIPTAENLALAFWDRLDRGLAEAAPGCRLGRLRLVESENNAVEVER